MVHAIPFEKLQKIWVVICDDAIIFYSFQLTVCSADLDILVAVRSPPTSANFILLK